MRIPLSVHIRAFFARDKDAYWWNHWTDEEKQLRRMDVWEIAKVIHEESVHQSIPEKKIVAEHMLNVRLAQIQARATHVATFFAVVGAVGGALLTTAFQSKDNKTDCVCKCERSSPAQQANDKAVQTVPPVTAVTNVVEKPSGGEKKCDGKSNHEHQEK